MSKPTIQTCSAFALPVEAGEWIPIIPVGAITMFDGRGPFKLKDAGKVIADSLRRSVELVIERDHVTDHAPPGTPCPAAGWIKELKEQDGQIMARVEWTPPAQEQLKNREYRYISPVFTHDKDGQVLRILRASLTNFPAIEMKAVASADPQLIQTKSENTMEELLQELAALLGLEGESVSADAVKEKITALKASVDAVKVVVEAPADAETPEQITEAVEEHVKEVVEEAVEAATAKLRKVTASAKGNPDPSKYVPIDAFNEVKEQVANLVKATAETTVTASVDAALKAGKITPAQKAWATDYATKDAKGFAQYIEKAPVLVAASSQLPTVFQQKADDAGLTGSEANIAAQLGISADKMKASRRA